MLIFFTTAEYYMRLRAIQPDGDFGSRTYREICLFGTLKFLVILKYIEINRPSDMKIIIPTVRIFLKYFMHLESYKKFSTLYLKFLKAALEEFSYSTVMELKDISTELSQAARCAGDWTTEQGINRQIITNHYGSQELRSEHIHVNELLLPINSQEESLRLDNPNHLESEITKKAGWVSRSPTTIFEQDHQLIEWHKKILSDHTHSVRLRSIYDALVNTNQTSTQSTSAIIEYSNKVLENLASDHP